jgi:hypothetical protein
MRSDVIGLEEMQGDEVYAMNTRDLMLFLLMNEGE